MSLKCGIIGKEYDYIAKKEGMKMLSIKKINKKLAENNFDLTKLSDEENEFFSRVGEVRNHSGKLVKHFKGKFYLVLDTVEHTETGEELVIYQAMYDGYKKYARPIDMFVSKVDKIKYPNVNQEYRFELVELK